MKLFLIAMLAVSFMATGARAQEKDIAGASDHAAVGRYEGSAITFHERKAYGEILMPVRALERADRNTPTACREKLAGKFTAIGHADNGSATGTFGKALDTRSV